VTPAERRRRTRRRQALELRDKGWSLRAIAAHLGVHHDTVWRDLRLSDSGVANPTPAVGNRTPESDELRGVDWDAEMTQLSKEAQ
jgi:IS30 family transposase